MFPVQPDHHHGPSLTVACNGIGAVTMCPCGAITLALQYVSLRLEPAAFRELQGLLALAQHRLDGEAAATSRAAISVDALPVH